MSTDLKSITPEIDTEKPVSTEKETFGDSVSPKTAPDTSVPPTSTSATSVTPATPAPPIPSTQDV